MVQKSVVTLEKSIITKNELNLIYDQKQKVA